MHLQVKRWALSWPLVIIFYREIVMEWQQFNVKLFYFIPLAIGFMPFRVEGQVRMLKITMTIKLLLDQVAFSHMTHIWLPILYNLYLPNSKIKINCIIFRGFGQKLFQWKFSFLNHTKSLLISRLINTDFIMSVLR